ncbi:MAG: hypothetical protein ACKVP0_01875 [Pirellulaceae bacterium]
MGRKRLPNKIRRAKALRVMVNAEEQRRIEEAAKKDGFNSVSAWVRRLILREAQRLEAG